MAQPKEMNHTSTSLEDKEAFLDLDNEKDFLASWKSITVGETDKFDFDLVPASKGKKKSFDFDQADMDFNLDGDFGTSFNIDIPDLDISPPLKKKYPMRRPKNRPLEALKERQTALPLPLILMSNFDLGSTVKTPVSNIQIEKDNKEGLKCESSHEVEKGSVQNSRVRGIADIDSTRKPFQLSNMMKFDMDSLVGRRSHLDKKDPFSAVATLDVSPGNEEVQVACEKSNISTEATMAAAELAPNSVGQTSMQEFTSSFPSTCAQVANPSKKKENEDFMTKNDAESGGKEDVVLPTTVGTCSKSALPENLIVIKTLEKEGKIEDCVVEKMGKQEHIDFSSLSEISSNIRLATGILCEAPAPSGVDNQQTASHTAYMSQQTDASNITLNKGTKSPISGSTAGAVIKSQKHKIHSMPFSTLQTFSLLSAKKASVTQSTLPEGKRGLDGIQVDGKPVSLSLHSSNTLRGNESHNRTQNDLKMVRKICSVGGLSGEKETNNSSFKENDVLVKAKAKPCQREMIMKDLGILSMEVSENSSQNARNVKHASSPTTKSTAVEAERSSPVRARKKIPILCGLRSSGLNTDPAKYQNQAALKSAGPFSKNGTLSKNLVLDTTHVPKSQMNASPSVGVKRKTVEDNQGAISTHPPKRCFQSPPAKRSPEEELEKIVNKKDAPLNSPEEDGIKNKMPDCYESHFIHQNDKIRGLVTYSVEDNINKAEVYGKQLDDLCNMLKKKQDEAKDTLVQAIVNNNKLLLLNSPLFEHKISAARKQMARLSLSSNHACV